MATIFSHGVAALALGRGFSSERMPARFWIASVVCAMLPDLDVIGFAFGIHYGDMLGHRGLTHSLLFALLVGLATVALLFREEKPFSREWLSLLSYFSHILCTRGVDRPHLPPIVPRSDTLTEHYRASARLKRAESLC